jgi:hypothetical protein
MNDQAGLLSSLLRMFFKHAPCYHYVILAAICVSVIIYKTRIKSKRYEQNFYEPLIILIAQSPYVKNMSTLMVSKEAYVKILLKKSLLKSRGFL